ncbi:hypothetical protein L0V05_18905 [Tabrizicola sp. J26]|uniref:hypothetical protein n=1 Tax=Alitabrizicola rongguiensis TaxID=2909234 RepID=UPI001F1F6F38|nr:hypothetical protein [Tabrizicola rongguiensis]MCF1710883.1 hypothetical protein [Tabrizicola rongguiensis]
MGEPVVDRYRRAARTIRPLLAVHLVLRLMGVAVMTPLAVLAIAEAMRVTGRTGITDKDIVWFFYLLPGTLTLLAFGALAVLAAVLDITLMSVVLAARETRATVGVALAIGVLRRMPGRVLGSCGHLALRLIWAALPYVAGLMLVQRLGLRRHELDYYLVTWPPEFMLAMLIAVALAAGLVRAVTRRLAEAGIGPLLALSGQRPVQSCLDEKARILSGVQPELRRRIAIWAAIKLILVFAVTAVMAGLTGTLPGLFGADLRQAAAVVAGMLALWAVLASLVAALSNGALAGLLLEAYDVAGGGALPQDRAKVGPSVILLLGAGLIVVISAVTAPRLIPTFVQTPDIQIVARPDFSAQGNPGVAAGIRSAIASDADWILIGLRSGPDGSIALASGGQEDPADLRDVLELAAAAGARLLFDLDVEGDAGAMARQLSDLVDDAGMAGSVAVMSPNIAVINQMRLLRPGWRTGVRAIWPMGDLSGLDVDFLALNSGQVTMKRIWRAKSAGKEIYAWPADRPLIITRVIEQGVNGVVTADPALASQIAEAHGGLPLTDRLLLWLAGRLNPASLRLAEPSEMH